MDPIYILKSSVVPSSEALALVSHQPEVRLHGALKGSLMSRQKAEHYNDVYLYPPGDHPDMCNNWIRLRECGRSRLRSLTASQSRLQVPADVLRVAAGGRLHHLPTSDV